MKVKIYFEPSALFKAYIPEKGSENVEKILSMLGDEIIGLTSRWTILEIIRGIIKRRNLGELAREDADDIIKFFLYDLKKMEMERKLILIDVSKKIIEGSIEYIIKHNLYAADALHLKTAEIHSADAMLIDDYHFKRIQGITKMKLLNVDIDEKSFEKELKTILASKNLY